MTDFARQLERELNATKAKLDTAELMRESFRECSERMESERDQWKACAKEFARACRSSESEIDQALAHFNELSKEQP